MDAKGFWRNLPEIRAMRETSDARHHRRQRPRQLGNLEVARRKVVRTPYGEPSGPLTFGRIAECDVVFLARHGYGHTIAPHEVNYRANIWALKDARRRGVVSVASVGGIRNDLAPGMLVVPHQIIDYTWGRLVDLLRGRGQCR